MEHFAVQAGLFVVAVCSLTLSWYAGKKASPSIAIISRWVRWMFIAYLASGTIFMFEWTNYSFLALFGISAICWFILETAYNWLAIKALSFSEMPLFPVFQENRKGDEWPSDKSFLRIKDYLRRQGFKKAEALISFIEGQALMRLSVYENEEKTIRVQILFFPHVKGNTTVCFALNSITAAGSRIVTDNVFLPFGGFYPDSWFVERMPLKRSIENLHKRHLERIDAHSEELIAQDDNALDQINSDQRELERLNRDLGFLHNPDQVEDEGRLTTGARARLWQEIWTLSYLGKSLKYH